MSKMTKSEKLKAARTPEQIEKRKAHIKKLMVKLAAEGPYVLIDGQFHPISKILGHKA